MTSRTSWSDGQGLALEQLEALADRDRGLAVLATTYDDARRHLELSVSLPLDGLAPGPGIRLRQREKFILVVRETFPFTPPAVLVPHRRWAGAPHVQWGSCLCLYAAPSTEWVPSDGMRGLVERLMLWLERAAAGTLDADGVPLHPPVAYGSQNSGRLVVRADLGDRVPWRTPSASGPAQLIALCTQAGDRLDIVDWMAAPEYWQRVRDAGLPTGADGARLVAAAAVVLPADIGFEYPENGADLLRGLAAQGVPTDDLLAVIAAAARGNVLLAEERGTPPRAEDGTWPHGPGGVPQLVVVGTPSREVVPGERVAHLVAWRLDPLAGRVSDLLGDLMTKDSDRYDDLREEVAMIGRDWLAAAPAGWARVFEDRAEATRRRDSGSSATWLHGKRVLVLGCGALGGPIAEAVVRAGASETTLVDDGVVTPGILVRQPYEDQDIGRAKAFALAERLRRCRSGTTVIGDVQDAVDLIERLPGSDSTGVDLIIDATADAAVRSALERRRARATTTWPALLTVLVGHRARRGVIAVSRPGSTGGGGDVLRRVGIAARGTQAAQLADVAADLYPRTPRTDVFLPEPGCSAPTFTGSQVEAVALAAAMLSAGLDALTDRLPGVASLPMAAAACRLEPTDDDAVASTGTTWVGWPEDHVQRTVDGTFQVRLDRAALATIRAEVRRGARLRGGDVETGGMLLGEVDEATGVVFVDTATAPTPDSLCSAMHFQHGVEGSQDLVDHHLRRSGGLTTFVGMWHTHPGGPSRPSPTDEAGMANLVTPVLGGPPRCLLLIVGGPDPAWSTWRDGPVLTAPPEVHVRVVRRRDLSSPPPPQPPRPPGNYVRADDPAPFREVAWWRRWRGGRR